MSVRSTSLASEWCGPSGPLQGALLCGAIWGLEDRLGSPEVSHLASLSSHLPAYLVAAFAKRLARLALTAPPEALLMALPFICNLLRRHPACRVLVHRPQGPGESGWGHRSLLVTPPAESQCTSCGEGQVHRLHL